MYSRWSRPARVPGDRSGRKRWLARFMVFMVVAGGLADATSVPTTRVNTKFGQIRGIWSRSTRGRLAAHYLGIPYALPPVGDLRFRSPQPWNRVWNGTYSAERNAPMCIQLDNRGNIKGSEDCLYLNIFVPVITDGPHAKLENEKSMQNGTLPVMVFVHGGAFKSGSADSGKFPPDYLMDQDIILVTINYRLNILGFFSTMTRASPGNYGLKDIVMALRWVNENIASFHGDPNSVTLWGHSAGACAVHLLALSNKTEGLFNRYILQSGSAFCPWTLNTWSWARTQALQTARSLRCFSYPEKKERYMRKREIKEENNEQGEAKKQMEDGKGNAENAGTTTTTTTMQLEVAAEESDEENNMEYPEYSEEEEENMMWCLRNTDIRDLVNQLKYYQHISRKGSCCPFAPVIEEESDDAVVTMHPITTVDKRLFRDIPLIIGVVEDEGLIKTDALLTNETAQKELLNNFEAYLPHILDYYQLLPNVSELVSAVEEFYFGGNVSATLTRNITAAVSDANIIWPVYQTLKYQSEIMSSSTYLYLFSYKGTFSYTFNTGNLTRFGVAHVDDLNYLIPTLNAAYKDQMLHNTENDITMINIMTEMWASFAAKGVPKAWRVTPWPNYGDINEFLRFGMETSPEIFTEGEFFPERMSFWDKLTANLTFDYVEPDFLIDIQEEEPISNDCSKETSQVFTYLSIILCSIYFL